ncbi:DUF2752 domain-containing protein [Mesonia aquimarina]|uniref:DUF2752 domain-containing protein n=1 Tax=Mesonia aquimarina TaxID=1504967 RepID=UPI000EF59BC6|nr:DUF2752 domain-containing protein [Mesonia aquimarina]
MEEFMLPCLNKKFFGFECPGCGGQRALVFLLKGEFKEAFLIYPAIYPLVILGLIIGLNLLYPVKYYAKLTSVFAAISVSVIILSYIFKFI